MSGLAASQVVAYGLNVEGRWKYRHLPGPTPRLFVGNLGATKGRNIWDVVGEWSRTYGKIYCWFEGRNPVVVISGAPSPAPLRCAVCSLSMGLSASTNTTLTSVCRGADPDMAQEVMVRKFNVFTNRVMPGIFNHLGKGLRQRMNANMVWAKWVASPPDCGLAVLDEGAQRQRGSTALSPP